MPSLFRRPSWLPALLCVVLLGPAACSDDDTHPEPDASADASVDAQVDAQADATTGDPCLDNLVLDTVLELDPTGPDTQLHTSVAFDGEGVWVVWNRTDASSYFDVWAQRLGCDGTALVAPFMVNTTDNAELDPAVAVGDGNVYFVWQADSGIFPNNMDMFLRTYGIDGTPLMASDAIVETTYDGTPATGNVMRPIVTALPGGQLAVAGLRGVDAAPSFQVFAQRLSADGSPLEEALSPIIEPAAMHDYPAVAARPDGTLSLAWTRDETDKRVYHTTYAPSATTPTPDPPVEAVSGATGTLASLAADPDGDVTYLAFCDDSDVVLTTTAGVAGPAPVTFGGGLGQAHSPVLAARSGGGAMVYYTAVSGSNSDLRVAPFSLSASTLTAGAQTMLIPQTVPSYFQAAITHVSGDIYFVAWSAGDNPDYRIYGMFVELTP